MSDGVKEVAERYRKQEYKNNFERRSLRLSDMQSLANFAATYLDSLAARDGADDDQPATVEWLEGQGWEMSRPRGRWLDSPGGKLSFQVDESSITHGEWDTVLIESPTRRQVRHLLAALTPGGEPMTRLEIAAMLLATRYRDSYAQHHMSKAYERFPYEPGMTSEQNRQAEKAREAIAQDLIVEECLDLADLLIKKEARERPHPQHEGDG